ncbi:MAG: tRNA (adenosine(37)-N6)-dimethylallyltransferase MiaA [Clostridia bacterium]|nr:tRNA (adenosine(37)-N6)-dimethylallyltransferase MiaA [Clostridia bacterium]
MSERPVQKPYVYFIVGPTASGKTAVSIDIAERINAEIISADSIQIYKDLDIGSAKPSPDELRRIRHHLVDFVDVSDTRFNVAKYRKDALDAIFDITGRGKRALVVGGTGLYVNSLVFPLDFSAAPPDDKLRRKLTELEQNKPGTLHRMLYDIDPKTADRLHSNDTKRIIRAIEIYEQTGKRPSDSVGDFSNSRGEDIPINPIIVGINTDRPALYKRIEIRVDRMLESGLLDEVDRLVERGIDPSVPALQGLGYKQLLMYRRGELTYEEAVELIKRDTRRFAKRQISWFKRDARIRWLDPAQYVDIADTICDHFMTNTTN